MNRTTALLFISVIAATTLAGCGHDVYEKGNTTDTQYIQDENACFAYADQQPPAAIGYTPDGRSLNVEKERTEIRSCMIAKGYTLAPKWPLGPYGTSPTTNPGEAPLSIRQ
ncbi:MAG TPA: hypothetical protein VN718_03140 [Rhizomicrobium sp.]|nr:hypothetical protein [Rhizomicrobium sp.]